MRIAVFVLAIALLLGGCKTTPNPDLAVAEQDRAPAATPAASAPQLAIEDWPLSIRAYRTTSGEIYFNNLDARIETLTTLREEQPQFAAARLAGALYHRYQLRGRLDDLNRALEIAAEQVAHDPRDAQARVTRAALYSAVHRFADARADLDVAAADRSAEIQALVTRLTRDIAVATGDYNALKADLEQSSLAAADFYELAHRADLRLLLGDLPGAAFQFRGAQTIYRDVSPVPLAWLHTQIGIAYLRYGDHAEAARFFAAAVERLPGYVLAEEHLAECEHLLGRLDDSRTRYLRVIEATGNPEYMTALAAVEADRNDSAAALQWRERARASWEQWLKAQPLAYSGHAADFFLESNDSARAYRLVADAAQTRADVGTQIQLAVVAWANGRASEACAAKAKVIALGFKPPELSELDGLECGPPG